MQNTLAAPLTEREKEVMYLLAEYCTYKVMCNALGISYRTLNRHIENIMIKTGIHYKELLIKYAIDHGYGKITA